MVLQDILPDLDTEVIDVAELITYLINEGGRNNLANGGLFSSLEQFCLKDIKRIQTLLEYGLNSIDDKNDFISIALKMGSQLNSETYTQKAIELLSHENDIILNQTIFALESMKIIERKKRKYSVTALSYFKRKAL